MSELRWKTLTNEQDDSGTPRDSEERPLHEPKVDGDGTIHLYGVGPKCPGCGGPTHCVTADPNVEHPWWCKECNVRLDGKGNYGNQASFPSGSDPDAQ